jgi:hypothetical protein
MGTRQANYRPLASNGHMKVLILGLIALLAQLPAPNVFAPATDVSFTISVDRTAYTIRDEIPFRYRIVNVGKAPLYVPRGFNATACLEPHHPPMIRGWLQSAAGNYSSDGYAASCGAAVDALPLTLEEWMKQGATLLRPGEAVEGVLRVSATSGLGASPGTYRVGATLVGWNERSFPLADFERTERAGLRLLRGEVATSAAVTLTR